MEVTSFDGFAVALKISAWTGWRMLLAHSLSCFPTCFLHHYHHHLPFLLLLLLLLLLLQCHPECRVHCHSCPRPWRWVVRRRWTRSWACFRRSTSVRRTKAASGIPSNSFAMRRLFLVACMRLYKSLCRSVGRLVSLSVGRSVPLCFFCVFRLFTGREAHF